MVACAASSGAHASNMTVYATHSGLSGATTPSARPSAITQSGYRDAGDGGWAEYDWNATSTATADGVAVVLPSGQSSATAGRYILRIPPGSGISPLFYGAKGDDATDDTAAIQAALTGAVTISAPLHFDCGHVYKVASGSLTSSGIAIIKGCPPVGNDGVNGAQNCSSGIDASGLNANLFVLSGPSGRIEDMCLQMASRGSQASAGAAVLLGGSDMESFGLERNTILRPYDGISFGGGASPNNLVRNSWARDNTIRDPARYGIAVGLGTTGGATVGITLDNNAIGCDHLTGIGFAFFDGAVKWDGTTVGPNNCYINSEIVPGANQNVNGEFHGVLGDSAGSHGGTNPMELYIEPQSASATINWLLFKGIWAGGVASGDTEVYLGNRYGGGCSNIQFDGMRAHSAPSQTDPIVDIEGCTNVTITASQIDAWMAGTVATGVNINISGSNSAPSRLTFTGNHVGTVAGATLTNAIQITSGNTGNPAYMTLVGNELTEANTPINWTPAITQSQYIMNIYDNSGIDDNCNTSMALSGSGTATYITIPASASCVHITGGGTLYNIFGAWANRKVALIADNGLKLAPGGTTAANGGLYGICGGTLTVPAAGAAFLQNGPNCWLHQ
jgi:hypothetical protein